MDGNTTQSEEDVLINHLSSEIPAKFESIASDFKQIDGIEAFLKQVINSREIDKVPQINQEIDAATVKLEFTEGLTLKYENELVELNAFKKLCRRDEQIAVVDRLLNDYNQELERELGAMEEEMQNVFGDKGAADKEEDHDRKEEGEKYMGEIQDMIGLIQKYREEKEQCFQEFDEDLPQIVKDER